MNACTTMPAPMIPLHRPVWQRAADALSEAWTRWSAFTSARGETLSLQDAMTLNDHTLRDIGVSEMLRDEAAARRGIDAMNLRASQLDFGDRGHHWYG